MLRNFLPPLPLPPFGSCLRPTPVPEPLPPALAELVAAPSWSRADLSQMKALVPDSPYRLLVQRLVAEVERLRRDLASVAADQGGETALGGVLSGGRVLGD